MTSQPSGELLSAQDSHRVEDPQDDLEGKTPIFSENKHKGLNEFEIWNNQQNTPKDDGPKAKVRVQSLEKIKK